MNILFIGGSRFVGKHAVLAAVERGFEVTLYNRGTQPLPAPGVRHIAGDRNGDLAQLRGETFDAVIDTSAYVPRQVRTAARALSGSVGCYLFISTISVYAEQSSAHLAEDGELIELADPDTEEVSGETYGGLKVLCERELEENFDGRKLVVRPGIVVGPDDPTDRFTYWPVRASRGGEVLAPSGPQHPVQWVDARDLGRWLVQLLEEERDGVYNAVNEADRFTFGDLLEASLGAADSSAKVTWVDEGFLLEHEIRPSADLPLWIPGERSNFFRIDGSKAHAAGLRVRPASESAADTLEWFRSTGRDQLMVGLAAEREREVLEEWHRRK